jgi:hypothetical protein
MGGCGALFQQRQFIMPQGAGVPASIQYRALCAQFFQPRPILRA